MEENIKKLNEIIEEYINYLYKYNPMFLNNAGFFFELTIYDERLQIKNQEYKLKKMDATDSFKIAKEFIEKYYGDKKEELESLFNGGFFDIYYVDELKDEKIYLTKEDVTFNQNKTKMTFPLCGDVRDVTCIIHEIRHQLNQPSTNRSISNDLLTEGISIFDEFLVLDFLKDKLDVEEINKIKKLSLAALLNMCGYVNFVCKLIIIKDKLGYINIENYKLFFDDTDLEHDIKNVEFFLKTHDSYKDIDVHIQNWYAFGVYIASFMHQRYLEDESYLEKFKLLNEKVKQNCNIVECLKVVDIDLNDPNIVSILRNSLVREIENLEKVKKM